jgi:glycosyltransferase involved in cell wall biosynthesis
MIVGDDATLLSERCKWIVCQIGAREHYALPRALHREGLLKEFITDAWVPPNSALGGAPGKIGARLRGRFDRELETANVCHFTRSMIGLESTSFLGGPRDGWNLIIRRNEWFQDQVVRHLRVSQALCQSQSGPPIVLAYSYAARKILSAAREAGARTILGQIDGGVADEQFLACTWSKHADVRSPPPPAPASYWKAWREECEVADRIVVNSTWSRDLIVKAGIDRQKIGIVPVIYEPQSGDAAFSRQFPVCFTPSRPLRALFLGALTIRKGVLETLHAADLLRDDPIEFWFVGRDSDNLGELAKAMQNVIWKAAVPRREVERFYADADIFLFPTHSDGFGMTQVEAQDWGLPIIASKHCGAVVEHERNGLLLEEVSGESIAKALRHALRQPSALASMSACALDARGSFTSRNILHLLLEMSLVSDSVQL